MRSVLKSLSQKKCCVHPEELLCVANCKLPSISCGVAILLGSFVRDLAVLFLHLLATVARLAGPGGARSVVAESVLVKQQLLILNRSRKRSPSLRLSDRTIAGVCALLIRPRRLIRSAIVFTPSTLLGFHRALPATAEVSTALRVQCAGEAGPKGTQPGSCRSRRRHETATSDLGLSTDRATDHVGVRNSYQLRMWCVACSPFGTS